jgi:uncharacterized RDD family membrane protein YckC
MEEKQSILEDIETEEVEVPYMQRLLTNITDGIIEVIIIVAFYLIIPKEIIYKLFEMNSYMKYFVAFTIVFGYRLICFFLSGKTIGMLICRTKYLNAKLLPLTPKERLIAVFVTRASGIKYYKA